MKEALRAAILNGSLTDHKTHLAGFYRGYHITLIQNQQLCNITVNACRELDADNVRLREYLVQRRAETKKIMAVQVMPYRFTLTLRAPVKKLPGLITELLEPILLYLSTNGYASGCGCCGTAAATLSCWQMGDEVVRMCDDCAKKADASLSDEQRQIKAKKSNFIGGLVGAFLGALIGAAAWVLIAKLGYIAGVAGLITGVCAMKGYELLGGHLDKKGVICSIVIMVAMIFFANKLAWSWELYGVLKEYGASFSDCYRNFFPILSEAEGIGSFAGDLAIGYGLTAVASIPSIISAFRASNGSYTLRKLD